MHGKKLPMPDISAWFGIGGGRIDSCRTIPTIQRARMIIDKST